MFRNDFVHALWHGLRKIWQNIRERVHMIMHIERWGVDIGLYLRIRTNESLSIWRKTREKCPWRHRGPLGSHMSKKIGGKDERKIHNCPIDV